MKKTDKKKKQKDEPRVIYYRTKTGSSMMKVIEKKFKRKKPNYGIAGKPDDVIIIRDAKGNYVKKKINIIPCKSKKVSYF